MKFMIEAQMCIDTGNEAIKDGSLMKVMEKYLHEIKPEAVYFTIANGTRTMFMVVDISGADKLPRIVEPLWLKFSAEVQMHPIMTAQDLQKAGPDIMHAVKNYG